MNYDGIRAVRIYDDGFINGILVERSSRKWDYVLTMRNPLRMTKIPKGDFRPMVWSIPDFMSCLKARLGYASFTPSQPVVETINRYS